jgi:hypothetical protein
VIILAVFIIRIYQNRSSDRVEAQQIIVFAGKEVDIGGKEICLIKVGVGRKKEEEH